MKRSGRLASVVLSFGLAMSLVSVAATTASAAPTTPPNCATDDPNQNCVHAATSDITALPAPAFTTAYDAKTHQRTISFTAAITPPYHQCPDGGVPNAQIPCSFRGLSVAYRIYQPGAKTLLSGGAQVVATSCDFSCPVTITLGPEFHGPATMILRFGVGDLIVAANDLTGSSYEVPVPIPADPVVGTFHPTKPAVVMTGKLRSATLRLAGHAGIPRTGVGGVLVRVWSTGQLSFRGGDTEGLGLGVVQVVKGSTLTLKKKTAGSVTVTVLGWYGATLTTTGGLLHRVPVKKVKPAAAMHLRSAGVPLDATAVIVAVITPKGSSRVGGVLVNKSFYGQYVVAPLKPGAVLAVTAAKGTKVEVFGYAEPIHPVDDGGVVATQSAQPLDSLLGLPEAYTLS